MKQISNKNKHCCVRNSFPAATVDTCGGTSLSNEEDFFRTLLRMIKSSSDFIFKVHLMTDSSLGRQWSMPVSSQAETCLWSIMTPGVQLVHFPQTILSHRAMFSNPTSIGSLLSLVSDPRGFCLLISSTEVIFLFHSFILVFRDWKLSQWPVTPWTSFHSIAGSSRRVESWIQALLPVRWQYKPLFHKQQH